MRAALLVHTANVDRRTKTKVNLQAVRGVSRVVTGLVCRFEPLSERLRATRLGNVPEAAVLMSYLDGGDVQVGDLVEWIQAERRYIVKEIKSDVLRFGTTPDYHVATLHPFRGGEKEGSP